MGLSSCLLKRDESRFVQLSVVADFDKLINNRDTQKVSNKLTFGQWFGHLKLVLMIVQLHFR